MELGRDVPEREEEEHEDMEEVPRLVLPSTPVVNEEERGGSGMRSVRSYTWRGRNTERQGKVAKRRRKQATVTKLLEKLEILTVDSQTKQGSSRRLECDSSPEHRRLRKKHVVKRALRKMRLNFQELYKALENARREKDSSVVWSDPEVLCGHPHGSPSKET
mmetsp:Transcript_29602/g.114167  ORF Transcript_29602/g.114167 Transcript_29602/m.114167 type:complete len:162 (-) Transcript_29602:89-574(-)|eukprot:CAMPEP_0113953800 /NCGR_PEP_ID=MMETSP0011_2-20120614/51_1 /TAXON_ID=101924 /ORGANISM="Rhodosorus marinus" /LENGTH=161 /DNA_ID=CAMNT_0000962563 /DNA_START=257 /DNA_END=742 /DNA_ORIENTATION=- /assembly_acc=CAM_ASM_000156